jgi:hypothetical protein
VKSLLLRAAGVLTLLSAPWLVGCGGHTARTAPMRSALDAGNPKEAIAALNEELDVKSDKDLPKDIKGDNALLVLDRGSIQQSIVQFDLSKQDFEAADKAIDMLDLAHNAGDSIGEYVFSSDAGKYQAPPYEKLMINTLDMLNYLEQHDLNGAKVEARRLSVMQKYYKDSLNQGNNPVLGLGSLLAGFTFEKAGETDEALRYYDEMLGFSGFDSSGEAVARLASVSPYRSPHIKAVLDAHPDAKPDDNSCEVLFVIGYGRVPHKIPERIPIGLALTLFADSIQPTDREAANKLALQGLVTWINFPTLGRGQGSYAIPGAKLDNQFIQLEEAVNVEQQVRSEWKKIEGKIIVSAITRMVARALVGQGIQSAAGRNNVVGLVASLGTQATLTALDTPDTRSWETLPARVAVARVRLPAGKHRVSMDVRGYLRTQEIVVQKGGWQVVSLMALR